MTTDCLINQVKICEWFTIPRTALRSIRW